jgi:hypothetical protein
MIRRPDWQPRLLNYVETARLEREFTWDANNCIMFVAGGIDAICEDTEYVQMLSFIAPLCTNEAKTSEYVTERGGLKRAISEFLGKDIPWGSARAGDVVLIHDGGGQEVAGLCVGAQVVCATTRGVIPFRLSRAIAAWRIG